MKRWPPGSSRDRDIRPSSLLNRILTFALLALPACKPASPPPPAPVSLEKMAPDFNLMASDFLREFDERKYSGKVVELTGIYFTCTLVDDNKHATDITLLASGWPDKLVFVLDREVMDKRWLILDYYSLIRMKGRFAGRDADGTARFTASVLTTTHVEAGEYPTALKVEATELTEAFWPLDKDVAEARKYAGRVIEVSGTVGSVEDTDVTLISVSESRPVRCRLEAPDAAIAPGMRVVLKGFCAGHVAGTTGVTVDRCVRP